MIHLNFFRENLVLKILIAVCFLVAIFFAGFRLSESPATWTDEGLIIQTSKNLVADRHYGFRIAPDKMISPSFISTSYTVTFPVAASFYVFGTSLLSARYVMVFYILLLIFILYFIYRDNDVFIKYSLPLLVTFPPLYGQGKNVLGEVPGLFFLVLSGYFLNKIGLGDNRARNFILWGLFLGLCVVTKPIFILVVPAALVSLVILYRRGLLNFKNFFGLILSGLLPFVIWILVQFDSTDGWLSILKYYSNPHSVSIFSAVIFNIKDFLTHFQTLFFGGVMMAWVISFVIRVMLKTRVEIFEIFTFVFSVLVSVFYFRNPPYYRYFFIAEILGLWFLAQNIFYLLKDDWMKKVGIVFIVLLIISQAYQLMFSSWVAKSYNSSKTKIMSENLSNIDGTIPVFIYQAPEAVTFLKTSNYYQYFSGTIATAFGTEGLSVLGSRDRFFVLTKESLANEKIFSKFKIKDRFAGYVILNNF